jgi:hypothetical protein
VINPIAHPWRDSRRHRRFVAFTVGAILALILAGEATPRCYAQDASTNALQLSDHAFAMLNSLNAAGGKPGPLFTPAASLAGDAQALSTALSAHDNAAASSAMAAILGDRARIEAAAQIAGGHYPNEWDTIREKIAALEKTVPAAKGGTSSMSAPASIPAVSSAPPPSEKMPVAPKIAISSRVFKAGIVRVKGFLEGTDLKSAGIYDGDQKSKDIDVASTPGEQRINFDFSIEQPSPSQSIRVTDSYGREASAMIAPDPAGVGAMKGNEELIEVEPGVGASSGGVATSSGSSSAEPERLASAGPPVRNNIAEIPRPADALSPSHRHMNEGSTLGPLTNVQINVIDAEELMSAPGTVEVVGQIAGPGVRHAGVYVGNRLVKSIPVSTGGYSAFDVTFPMQAGSDARIRAYGNGNDFIEASIDTVGGGGGMSEYRNPPMYGYNPYAYPPSPYYRPNPYAYANPYAPGVNPYAPNPYYGYPPNYAPPPYGTPPYGTPPPAPSKPWYNKLFR